MRRVTLLSLVVYALTLTGLVARSGPVLALSLLFVTYLAASFLRAPAGASLEITRTLNAERVGSNVPVEVTMTVTNSGLSLEEVLIEDGVPHGLMVSDGSPRHVLKLAHGQTATWMYTVRGSRGCYAFSPVKVKAYDPLGLVSREQTFTLPAAERLFILPPVLRLKHVSIRPRRTRVYSGLVPARVGGTGTDFFGIREYQDGDPPHWINWHATARHPEALFSNEFEQERVTDIGIVLDGRQRANLYGHQSILEYSTLAAAALADAFLSQGNRVSLLIYGRFLQWTLPGYGKVQRERILRALALAEMGDSQAFADLDNIPTRLFPAHSQVVLISPLVHGDSPLLREGTDDVDVLIRLRARGYQIMVISPDPVAFEESAIRANPLQKVSPTDVELAARVARVERGLLLQRLQRAGIQVINWDVSKSFEQTVNSQLSRPLAYLRATGRSLPQNPPPHLDPLRGTKEGTNSKGNGTQPAAAQAEWSRRVRR
ncbi:MAG: DUF58 domain-containing protein [Anaerolineae bacterium]|nr:DUF58 domain-containing protein [Anaerolineae bacterium]